MPKYTWKCNQCKEITIVERERMSHFNLPPDNGCEHCQSMDLKRILSPSLINGYTEKGFYNSQKKAPDYDPNDFDN